MRILILQENGRHDANRRMRECFCLQRALEAMGHDVIVWGLNQPNQLLDFDSLVSWCHAIVCLENYNTGWVPDLSGVSKPKIFWSIDSHCAYAAHLSTVRKQKIDVVLCSCRDDVERFRDDTLARAEWFPNAYPDDIIKRSTAQRENVLGYCGSPGSLARIGTLVKVAQAMPLRCDFNRIGPDMVQCIGGYGVGLNYNIAHDINYRTFETCGVGTCLLTNHTPGIDELFGVGEIAIYSDVESLIDIARALLANDADRNAIAEGGYKRASMCHTYANRASELIDIINGKDAKYRV